MPKAYPINLLGCTELTLALKNHGLLSLHCTEDSRIAQDALKLGIRKPGLLEVVAQTIKR